MKKLFLRVFIILLLLILLVVGGGLLGGYFAYNKYAKPKLGITYGQAINLYLGINKKIEEEDVVKNQYNITLDSNKGIESIKRSLFIRDGFDIDTLTELIPKKGDPSQPIENEKKVKSIIEKMSFDFQSIKNGDTDINEKRTVALEDKEIAAIAQKLLINLSSKGYLDEIEKKISAKLPEVITIKQVIFKKEKSNSLLLTLSVKLEKVYESLLKNIKIPNFAKKVVSNILLKRFFVTLEQDLDNRNKEPVLQINNLSPTNQSSLNKVLENLEKSANINIKKTILGSINKIFNLLEENKLNPVFQKGEVKLDTLQGLIKLSGLKVKEEDLLEIIKTISSSSTLTATHKFSDDDLNVFLNNELSKKYGIASNETNKLNPVTLFSNIKQLSQFVDLSKLDMAVQASNSKLKITQNQLGALIAEYFSKTSGDKFFKENGIEIIQASILKDLPSKEYDNVSVIELLANINIQNIVTSKMNIDKNSLKGILMSKLVKSIFSDDYKFKITIAYSANSSAIDFLDLTKPRVVTTSIDFNGYGVETRTKFTQISSFIKDVAGKDISLISIDEVANNIDNKIKTLLVELSQKFDSKDNLTNNAKNISFNNEEIELPSIYQLIIAQTDINDGAKKLTNDEMRLILKKVLDKEYVKNIETQDINTITDQDFASFKQKELVGKYFLKDIPDLDEHNFTNWATNNITSNFYTDIIDIARFAKNTKNIEDLDVLIGARVVGALVKTSAEFKNLNPNIKSFDIKKASYIFEDAINKIKIEGVIGVNINPDTSFSSLLPNKLAVVVKINLDGSNKYQSSISMQDLSTIGSTANKFSQVEAVDKIIGNIVAAGFSIKSLENDVTKSIKEIFSKIDGTKQGSLFKVYPEGNGTTFNLKLTNIYSLINNILFEGKTNKPSPANLKSTLDKINNKTYVDEMLINDVNSILPESYNEFKNNEVIDKYYIANNTSISSADNLFDWAANNITEINYKNLIDFNRMTSEKREISELDLNLSAVAIGSLINRNNAFTSFNATAGNVDIKKAEYIKQSGNNFLKLSGIIKLDRLKTQKLEDLMPDSIEISIFVTLSNNPLKNFDVNVEIQHLSNTNIVGENISEYGILDEVIKKVRNEAEGINLADIQNKVKAKLKNITQSVDSTNNSNKIKMSYVEESGKFMIKLNNIYSVIREFIYKDEASRPSANDLKKALYKINNDPLTITHKAAGPYNTNISDVAVSFGPADPTGSKKEVSDETIANYIVSQHVDLLNNFGNGAVLKSFAFISKDLVANQTNRNELIKTFAGNMDYDFYSQLNSNAKLAHNLVMFTISVKVNNFIDQTMPEGLLPENVDITVVYDITQKEPNPYIEIMYSSLSKSEANIINSLMIQDELNTSETKFSVQVKKLIDAIGNTVVYNLAGNNFTIKQVMGMEVGHTVRIEKPIPKDVIILAPVYRVYEDDSATKGLGRIEFSKISLN